MVYLLNLICGQTGKLDQASGFPKKINKHGTHLALKGGTPVVPLKSQALCECSAGVLAIPEANSSVYTGFHKRPLLLVGFLDTTKTSLLFHKGT